MNGRVIAFAMLVFNCLFILDDSPFTSVWDCLPEVQIEQVLIGEEQEESLAISNLLKVHARSRSSLRVNQPLQVVPSILVKSNEEKARLYWQSNAAAITSMRDRSVNFCIFQI